MANVIGIGGIFFKFKNPAKMREWYAQVLGLTTNDYGVLFEFNGGKPDKAYLQLGTFEKDTDYFGSADQQAMINFRIDNLIEFIKVLEKKDVVILNTLEEYSYGKFLHIADPEGNRIELWEPVDGEFEKSEDEKMPMR